MAEQKQDNLACKIYEREPQTKEEINLKLAEFMGYNVTYIDSTAILGRTTDPDLTLKKIPNGTPIYTTKPFPKKHLEDIAKHPQELNEFLRNNIIGEWNPVESIADTLKCDKRLRELGKYDKMEIDYSWSKEGFQGAAHVGMDVVSVQYFGMYSNDIIGSGSNLSMAIIDACLKFQPDKYKKGWDGIMMDNTDKHP